MVAVIWRDGQVWEPGGHGGQATLVGWPAQPSVQQPTGRLSCEGMGLEDPVACVRGRP